MSLRALLDAFARAGGKPATLLRRIGVSAETQRRSDARIPFDALLRAWEIAPGLADDDAFGLHVGSGLRRGAFGLLEYCARASATLRDAVERLVRYQRLAHDRARFALSTSGPRATLSAWIVGLPAGGPRHFNEHVAAALLTTARDMTGVDFEPLEVAFQHREPRSLVEHRRVLRAPLRFGAPQNQITVPAAVLDLPLRESDPALVAVLDDCASDALARLPPISDGLKLCRDLIAAQVAAGVSPRIGYIARELAVSQRSLQRALHTAGWTFRDIVDDVRRELALALTIETTDRAAQIAHRLGYAEPSAFHSAFRRWTGHTVSELRRHRARLQQG